MKQYILATVLSTLSSIQCAEQPNRSPREWMAQEYAQTNTFQAERFLHWIKEHNIPVKDQNIISIGCGTGEIEAALANRARSVHGIDASKNMITYAQAHHNATPNLSFRPNLSFQHCFAEDFKTQQLHDLAFSSCCFHWIEDKPKALQAICKSLVPAGLFFANIETTTNSEPFGITVFEEMKRDVPIIGSILTMLPNPTGSTLPTEQELQNMLDKAGFRVLMKKIEPYNCTMTSEEWRNHQLPLLLSTPGAQMLINYTSDNWFAKTMSEQTFWWITMSEKEKTQHNAPFFPECQNEFVQKIRKNNFCRYLFNNFLNRCLNKMQNNGNGTYTWRYETTLIFAQKK